MDEGINLGISRGRKEGIDEGRYELIMSMIKNQMPDELISKVTGLSIEEINKIRSSS